MTTLVNNRIETPDSPTRAASWIVPGRDVLTPDSTPTGRALDELSSALSGLEALAGPALAAPLQKGYNTLRDLVWVHQDSLRAARGAADEARANYEGATRLLADMHAAAVGEVTGPIRGVVEDVADVRSTLLATQEALGYERAGRATAEADLAARPALDDHAGALAARDEFRGSIQSWIERGIISSQLGNAALRRAYAAGADAAAAVRLDAAAALLDGSPS